MKKIMTMLLVIMLCAVGVAAAAQPIAPEGFTVTPLYDFTSIPDGEYTVSQLAGFWLPPGISDFETPVSGGVITIDQMSVWGAFPNLNAEQTAVTANATGWGFYTKNDGMLDVTASMSFNGADGKNYILSDYAHYVLVTAEGERIDEYTFWNGGNNQGALCIPSGFEGYVYVPFAAYMENNGTESDYFDSAIGMATPIFAVNDGETVSFGELYAFTTQEDLSSKPTVEPTAEPIVEPTDEPTEAPATDEPTEEPSDPENTDNGWMLWVGVAAAVVAVAVVVIIIGKRKK